ncbi:MAG: SnoaL-like domain-containing protein [Saprospiraceae bacterium]
MMNVQEIANRLVELCRKGEYQQCYQELYSPEVQSIEMDGSVCNGLEEMAKKGKEWNESIQEFHGSSIGEPIVSGNFFTLAMSMDVTFKNAPARMNFEEMCLYQVKDEKIIKEQFFYDQL